MLLKLSHLRPVWPLQDPRLKKFEFQCGYDAKFQSCIICQAAVDVTLRGKQAERVQLLKQPRRVCGIPPAPVDPQVIGKVSTHLIFFDGECDIITILVPSSKHY